MKKLLIKTLGLSKPHKRRLFMGKLASWIPDVLVEPPLQKIDGELVSYARHHINTSLEKAFRNGLIQGKILDLGAGHSQFLRNLIGSKGDYKTCDCYESEEIDYTCTIYELYKLFEENTFDTVLNIEVLEHLEEPTVAIEQILRILKPGGHLILTTPFNYPIHRTEYYDDYWRFTEFGLKRILKDFGLVEITPHGHPKFPYGYFVVAQK